MGLISNGTTIFDAGAMAAGGSMVFIKKITASGDTYAAFTDGTSDVVFDDTYKEYLITVNNWNPATDDRNLEVSFTINRSNYGNAKTSTYFTATHGEDDSGDAIAYQTGGDLADSTGNQILALGVGSGADESCSGLLRVFNPASTTFIKHFIGEFNTYAAGDITQQSFVSGYIDVTGAVFGMKFEGESGSAFDGVFCLYGIR